MASELVAMRSPMTRPHQRRQTTIRHQRTCQPAHPRHKSTLVPWQHQSHWSFREPIQIERRICDARPHQPLQMEGGGVEEGQAAG